MLSSREPDKIITARRGSPIVIGIGEGETIIASDASAIVAYTQRVIYLDDNDIAIVSADSVDIRDLHNIPVTREIAQLAFDAAAAEKGGFDHFMLKEIHEQPDSLVNAIRGRLDFNLGSSVLAGMGTSPRDLAELDRVVLIGCGTSLHAEVQQAAEFRYRNPILGIVTEGDHETAECMDDFITIPPSHPLVATIPAAVALQLFAYHVARLRGGEIDQPRNLAKSVTVE